METSGNMGTKHLIPSAPQRTCTLVYGVQKVPCEAQCDGFGASTVFLGLFTIRLYHVSHLKRTIRKLLKIRCKSDESTDSYRKMVSWRAPKRFRDVDGIVLLPE
jgi:hypothetical protein